MDIREARLPDDAAAIEQVDTSFTTDAVFDVLASGDGFVLRERRLAAALTKRFPLDDLRADDRPWTHGFVAEDAGACVGFAACGLEAWNRRLVLWHLYVQPAARGHGIGRALVERVAALGRELGARRIWLETSNLNAPGVAAYRALAFSLTGIDTTLYEATPAEGEIALFFSRPIASAPPLRGSCPPDLIRGTAPPEGVNSRAAAFSEPARSWTPFGPSGHFP